MINIDTVFILGAGASKPYGYPLGWELKDEIINKFKIYYDELINFNQSSQKPDFNIFHDSHNSIMPKFIDALKKSNPDTSIDLFLSRNQEYADIVKLAIAMIILRSEVTGEFRKEGYKPDQDWYSYLFHRMSEHLPAPKDFDKYQYNKVKFITFNYDRSFDYYIYDRFINDFGRTRHIENSGSKFITFPIIHLYGTLSKLPWQENFRYDYRKVNNNKEINNAFYDFDMIKYMSKNIRIIQERINDEDIAKAKLLIESSKRIFFLGFGYADENLQVLGFPEIAIGKSVYGTVIGFTENEIGRVVRKVTKESGLMKEKKPNVYIQNNSTYELHDCKTLLRNWL